MSVVESASSTQIFDSIKQRRSVSQMTQEEPTRAHIERLLEAATYAPNHHTTEPWQFFVLTGAARESLGQIMAEALEAHMEDATSEKAQAKLAKERNKPLQAPVIIAVTVAGEQQQEGLLIENIEASAAAVQNMLLTAEEMGLATLWRTGNASYEPQVKQWLGLASDDHITAFVYVGFPRFPRKTRVPSHFSTKTTWLSE
jgi:nitroreductase